MLYRSLFLVIFFGLLVYFPKTADCLTLDYIYINSSVDEAAGGHAAVRLGETVFHFQYYDDGIFLLEKDQWSDFYHEYSNLQNRTLTVGKIPVSPETFKRIKDRLLIRYLLQKKRFTYLKNLIHQLSYFTSVQSGESTLTVNGLGFFQEASEGGPVGSDLKNRLKRSLGESFFSNFTNKLNTKLDRLNHEESAPTLPSGKINLYSPWLHNSGSSLKLHNLIILRKAVEILGQGSPLEKDLLISSPGYDRELTPNELDTLEQYKNYFLDSITDLLLSKRTDHGEAILLQTARFHALTHSILTRRLLLLYPFSPNDSRVPVKNLLTVKTHDISAELSSGIKKVSLLDKLEKDRHKIEAETRDFLFSKRNISELSYNILESAIGRSWDIALAKKNHDFLRLEEGYLIPGHPGLLAPKLKYTASDIQTRLQITASTLNQFEITMYQLYSYNIFRKNCVTELFSTIYSSFLSKTDIINALGGYTEPDEGLFFIPFESFNIFSTTFPHAEIETLPSYKKRYLKNLDNSSTFVNYLKESTTLTSSIYSPWEKDSVFLFFTDDTTLLRPLYGCLNLLYGALGSATGLLTSPIDSGKLLKRSGKGMLFSLPELLFVNIRKGSFPAATDLK